MTEQIKTKTKEQRHREKALSTLANLGGKMSSEDDIKFEGTKLVVPETMDLAQAVDTLLTKMRADEDEVSFSRIFRYRPWDGALAARNALFNAFGIVQQQATRGFFGSTPPQLIDINTDVDKTEQVPWGQVTIPHLPGAVLSFGSTHDPEAGLLFTISVTSPRKWRHHVQGLFRLIEDELETNSMYRGKAFDGQLQPQFLDLSGIDPANVIYSEEVMTQLSANVWSLIEHTDEMRRMKMPLKRAVLLEGPYGTGKTLAAFLTAQKAVANGWTFIYCRPGKDDLEQSMRTAQLYQPAVVFFEDVDTATDGEADATRMLDVFDGIAAKGTEIVGVLTTNHKERIHKGMVRPGRLDAVIHIGALDLGGIKRMVSSVIPADKLDTISDALWSDIEAAMEGFMPAFVKEAVDRAVRYAISRANGSPNLITGKDIVDAALGLRPQLELMEGASDTVRRPNVAELIATEVINQMDGGLHIDGDNIERVSD